MALIRQTKSATLFRCLVVPSLLLCCIFRRPVFQWIALAASVVWLSTELVFAYRQHTCRRKRTKSIQHLSELKSDPKGDQPDTDQLPYHGATEGELSHGQLALAAATQCSAAV